MPEEKPNILRKILKITGITLGSLAGLAVIAAVIGGFLFFNYISERIESPPPPGDEQRLETLRNDPMYSIAYPNATELRRAERGSGGFYQGTEDPPTITYFAGTNDSDDEIMQFFINKATENGWEIFRGPGKLSTGTKIEVIFHKEQEGVGSLFVDLHDPAYLNRWHFRENPLTEEYTTIIQVTLRAEHEDPPWKK